MSDIVDLGGKPDFEGYDEQVYIDSKTGFQWLYLTGVGWTLTSSPTTSEAEKAAKAKGNWFWLLIVLILGYVGTR